MTASKTPRSRLASVGIKILIGVALASNLFIGALLYAHVQSSDTVAGKVNEVLTIKDNLSTNLRMAIVKLQDEFLSLPEFFRTDPKDAILSAVEEVLPISERQLLKGRDAYSHLFDRNERRDLTKSRFIIQTGTDKITLSLSIFDANGNFADSIERLILNSAAPVEDGAKLRAIIDKAMAETTGGVALSRKVGDLNTKVADAGLAAETTRNEILQHVEEIRAMEHDLLTLRHEQRQFSLVMGGLAIFANMIALFFLVRIIVEKPLHNLTSTIDAINSGGFPDIPYRHRRDQIGILSGAINNFREALMKIHSDNIRKRHEKVLVEEMLATITKVVNTLENRAKELVHTSNTLKELAISTETRAENVTRQAQETAQHTGAVSESTVCLQSAFKNIDEQIYNQDNIVAAILQSNIDSRQYINELNGSIQAIGTIIATVKEITDQTKLLSLNATIEATRAGAAGKGFAVVADEVKALSLKTATATNDAKIKIEAIEEARSVLSNHLEEIDLRMQSLKQQTGNMALAIANQRSVTDNIARLACCTAENTGNVSRSIGEVRNTSARNRSLAEQVQNSSLDISEQLTTLLENTTTRLQQLANNGDPRADQLATTADTGQHLALPPKKTPEVLPPLKSSKPCDKGLQNLPWTVFPSSPAG